MSYKIEPMPLISFVEDSNIKLPRFQRKATWDKKQNFELCISVFQDYPVGVVIINKGQNVSWLLDGRQRRTALKAMRDNPVELYEWARTYIGFNKTADQEEIESAYWGKVEKYLLTEEKGQNSINDLDEDEGYGDEEETIENSFNSEKQRAGLTLLLKIILMVHQVKASGSNWERQFNFSDYCVNIKYQLKREQYHVNPSKLRSFLLDMVKGFGGVDALTQELFVSYYDDNCSVRDDKHEKFEKEVEKRWDYIKDSIETITKSEKLFEEARIGIIELTNVSDLDAQNIFSRINRGGTLLKAEELLSAKPYWNVEVNVSDKSVKGLVDDLYLKLGVETPDTIVRWDLAATIISRIKDNDLIFEKKDSNSELSMNQVTMGFKLISSFFRGGISGMSVAELEKDKPTKINWEEDIYQLVTDINTVCEILSNDSFFKYLQTWHRPISRLLGNAICLEFINIILRDWEDREKPMVNGAQYKAVQKDARILFDRLVFEYATKVWRGSGDSKMAADIKDWKARIKPIDEKEWEAFIKGALVGNYHGQKSTQKMLTPVLYYYYVLKDISPLPGVGEKFDVDHIYPQEWFNDNNMVLSEMKDSLTNLAILPKKDNISKNNKALKQITDTWLRQQIVLYSDINESDFDKYSDITKIDELAKNRGECFVNCFTEIRKTKLAN